MSFPKVRTAPAADNDAATTIAHTEVAMHSATSPRQHDSVPSTHAPRLRLDHGERLLPAVTYDSDDYAMLNRPLETERHFRRVVRHLQPTESDRLLEVGCGRGWLTQRLQRLCPATYGIDVNPRSIIHGVTPQLSNMDAVALHFDDEQFDKLYSFHAIEHIPDAEEALREMSRVVVPGGRILLVYPAEPIRGLYAMPGAWLGFGNPFLARRLHVHRFTPGRITRLAARVGLTHVQSAFDLLITPQFMTVLRKPASAR